MLVLLAQLARGSSLNDHFGAYAVVGEGGYDVSEVVKFLFWHVAELDLYVGIFPVAAFVLLAARVRSLDARAQELVVVETEQLLEARGAQNSWFSTGRDGWYRPVSASAGLAGETRPPGRPSWRPVSPRSAAFVDIKWTS